MNVKPVWLSESPRLNREIRVRSDAGKSVVPFIQGAERVSLSNGNGGDAAMKAIT